MSMSIPLTNWTLKPAGPCGLTLEATDIAGKQAILAHLYAHKDSHDIDMEVARLIAAAPELLAALNHALAALDDDQKLHPNWIYADAQNEAMQAIAKAEGRTP